MKRNLLWAVAGVALLIAVAATMQGAGRQCAQPKVPFTVHNLVTGKLVQQCQ